MNTTTTATTTSTASIPDAPSVNESLIRTATDKLTKSMGKDSLDDLVASRTRRSLLLCDTSSSMWDRIRTGESKIDALRKVVDTLIETHPVPVAAFSGRSVRLVDGANIPNPHGNTPMASAIRYAKEQGANHAVLVTDGNSSEYDVLDAAARFGGPIDVFYIGDGSDSGFTTAKRIAEITGGVAHLADLGAPKQLGTKIAGLLGDGSL